MKVRELLTTVFEGKIERHETNLLRRIVELRVRGKTIPDLTKMEENGWIRQPENRAIPTWERCHLTTKQLDEDVE